MERKAIKKLLAIFILLSTIFSSCIAEVWVVTSVKSDLSSLSKQQCKRLWLDDLEVIDGVRTIIVDQSTNSKVRTEFYKSVANLNQKELRSFRAKKIFSSGEFPPQSERDDVAVIEWILQKENRIGYIDSNAYRPNLKLLYIVKSKKTENDER